MVAVDGYDFKMPRPDAYSRSSSEVEQMILSIRNGTKYPF
jgi:hypothetical protein